MALPVALRARTLLSSLAVYGDSTAAAAGASPSSNYWYNVLVNGFSPVLSLSANGVGGETSTQMLARIVADTDRLSWWHICMDLPNGGESSATWLSNMAAAIALQPRTFVMPPAQDIGGSATNVTEAQQGLLSNVVFSGRTLNAADQAAYLAQAAIPANRAPDNRHFSNAGQAMQAATIKAWLVANNWLPAATPV